MKARKGFTLVELMVVVLIVGILAAVAIPMMQGRIDSAKWSEGKAAAGTIASSVRAYCAEKGAAAIAKPSLTADLGFSANDLNGTYFKQGDYAVSGVAVDATTGAISFTITVTPNATTAPQNLASATLAVAASAPAVWTEVKNK